MNIASCAVSFDSGHAISENFGTNFSIITAQPRNCFISLGVLGLACCILCLISLGEGVLLLKKLNVPISGFLS